MKIVISGGTGFIGRALCNTLIQEGHRVVVLARQMGQVHHRPELPVQTVEWNARDSGPWEQVLDGADAVINLAGAPIADARWTNARKQLITDSRVLTTRLLVRALSRWSSKPATFISASGIGYYGATDDHRLDEGRRAVRASWPICASHGSQRHCGLRSLGRESSPYALEWSWNKTAEPYLRCCCPSDSLPAVLSCREVSGSPGFIVVITSD